MLGSKLIHVSKRGSSASISIFSYQCLHINTLRPRQNGRHFADNIFKCIFLNENAWISLKISLKFVPKVQINNIPALVQIMAWRRSGDKPLSEPMNVSLLTHICVTRPQWVKVWWLIWHWTGSSLVQIMAWRCDKLNKIKQSRYVNTLLFSTNTAKQCIYNRLILILEVLHVTQEVWK